MLFPGRSTVSALAMASVAATPRADAVTAGVRATVTRPEPSPTAGTVIMVCGAVVGLYGLNKFLE